MDSFLQSIARDKIFWEDRRKEILGNRNSELGKEATLSATMKTGKLIKEQSLKNTIIEKGDIVRLKGQAATGNVLEIQGKQVIVAFGLLKSTVALDRLELISKRKS